MNEDTTAGNPHPLPDPDELPTDPVPTAPAPDYGMPTSPAPETPDPNDELPVPGEMYPTEVDARGDVVDALREERGLPRPETNDRDAGAGYA
jgi:hypothetical protein